MSSQKSWLKSKLNLKLLHNYFKKPSGFHKNPFTCSQIIIQAGRLRTVKIQNVLNRHTWIQIHLRMKNLNLVP